MIIMSSLNLFYAYSLVNIQAMYKLKLFPMRNFSLLLLLLFIYLFIFLLNHALHLSPSICKHNFNRIYLPGWCEAAFDS